VKYFLLLSCNLLTSCAYLYHIQIGDIDDRNIISKQYFEIKTNEFGLNLDETSKIIKIFASKAGRKKADKIKGIIALTQIGPKTGNPIYNEDYGKNILSLLKQKCPNGIISQLTSIREHRNYIAISGEIIKITGYCLTKKESK
jgi:hypothetical protein